MCIPANTGAGWQGRGQLGKRVAQERRNSGSVVAIREVLKLMSDVWLCDAWCQRCWTSSKVRVVTRSMNVATAVRDSSVTGVLATQTATNAFDVSLCSSHLRGRQCLLTCCPVIMLLPLTVVPFRSQRQAQVVSISLSVWVTAIRKLVCDYVLVNNTNLHSIPHCYQVIIYLFIYLFINPHQRSENKNS